MLDINFIRENKEIVKKAIKEKGIELDLDELLLLDEKRRELLTKVEDLRRQRNETAEKRDIERGREIKKELDGLEGELKKEEDRFWHLMLYVPNIPFDYLPDGGAENNKVLKKEGEPKKFNFIPKDHVELGEKLNILDISRAVKVSGPRFAYLKNEGVLLELALVRLAMDILLEEGFEPILPPVLIKKEITTGLGYWQIGGNENYYLVSDYQRNEKGEESPNELYLVGTGEHAVVPMFKDETLEEKDLPKRYAAFSSCFRREAGSYGKDTRGILRVHQFDKVEMVIFCTPEKDAEERKRMLSIVERLLKVLELPYQIVQLAKGDISLPAAETIDVETWIPAESKYRETHSISTTTDFQARRLNIKYGNKYGNKLGESKSDSKYVHILNGTALALGRIIIAILENYQQEDGSVTVPKALVPYANIEVISPKKPATEQV